MLGIGTGDYRLGSGVQPKVNIRSQRFYYGIRCGEVVCFGLFTGGKILGP
jgi:hypothetical protein